MFYETLTKPRPRSGRWALTNQNDLEKEIEYLRAWCKVNAHDQVIRTSINRPVVEVLLGALNAEPYEPKTTPAQRAEVLREMGRHVQGYVLKLFGDIVDDLDQAERCLQGRPNECLHDIPKPT